LGTYSFTGVQGYTGAISPITINSIAGEFDVVGGNGDGTAEGIDAQAIINGETITAAGNQFTFSDHLGSYAFAAIQGFTGTLATIRVSSEAGEFNLTGGNGDGTAAGTDAVAQINGIQQTGDGNRFAVVLDAGDLEIEFQAGFSGVFDAITVRSELFDADDEPARAEGENAVAIINGLQYDGPENRFAVAGTHGSYMIEFAEGFTGALDSITVTSNDGVLQLGEGELGVFSQGRGAEGLRGTL
jgi:hypothetical protein